MSSNLVTKTLDPASTILANPGLNWNKLAGSAHSKINWKETRAFLNPLDIEPDNKTFDPDKKYKWLTRHLIQRTVKPIHMEIGAALKEGSGLLSSIQLHKVGAQYRVLDGKQKLHGVLEYGLSVVAPVVVYEGLTEEEEVAVYLIANNVTIQQPHDFLRALRSKSLAFEHFEGSFEDSEGVIGRESFPMVIRWSGIPTKTISSYPVTALVRMSLYLYKKYPSIAADKASKIQLGQHFLTTDCLDNMTLLSQVIQGLLDLGVTNPVYFKESVLYPLLMLASEHGAKKVLEFLSHGLQSPFWSTELPGELRGRLSVKQVRKTYQLVMDSLHYKKKSSKLEWPKWAENLPVPTRFMGL